MSILWPIVIVLAITMLVTGILCAAIIREIYRADDEFMADMADEVRPRVDVELDCLVPGTDKQSPLIFGLGGPHKWLIGVGSDGKP